MATKSPGVRVDELDRPEVGGRVPVLVACDDLYLRGMVRAVAESNAASDVSECRDLAELARRLAGLANGVAVVEVSFAGGTGESVVRWLVSDRSCVTVNVVMVVITADQRLVAKYASDGDPRVMLLASPVRPAVLVASLGGALARATAARAGRSAAGDPSDATQDPTPVRRPLTRLSVVEAVAPRPGVVVLIEGGRRPVSVEWTIDGRRRLLDYAALGAPRCEPGGDLPALEFEFLPTTDPEQACKLLRRLLNAHQDIQVVDALHADGAVTRFVIEPRAERSVPGDEAEDEHVAPVTEFATCRDERLLRRLRALAGQPSTDRHALDWLAYALYANGLLDESVRCYLELIGGGRGTQEHYFYCGNAYFKLGATLLADDMWREALARGRGSRIGRKAAARLAQLRHAAEGPARAEE